MPATATDFSKIPSVWKRGHLLDLESLSADEITCILRMLLREPPAVKGDLPGPLEAGPAAEPPAAAAE